MLSAAPGLASVRHLAPRSWAPGSGELGRAAPGSTVPERGCLPGDPARLPAGAGGSFESTAEPAAPNGHAAVWADACSVIDLLAVDRAGLGGVCVRAQAGPVRAGWLQRLADMVPVVRRMPAGIGDAALLGGLDLAATLQAGRPVAARGLLAGAQGGVVVAVMAERIAPGLAGRLAAALDTGAGFGLVALDEGAGPDEACPAALRDRLAFHIDLGDLCYRDVAARPLGSQALAEAQALLPGVEVPDEVVQAVCATALALGIGSARAPLLALRAARAAAALAGEGVVGLSHAALAARLVLAPRATSLPAAEEVPPDAADTGNTQPAEDSQAAKEQPPAAQTQPPATPPDQREPGRADAAGQDEAQTPGGGVTQATELLLGATRAAIPAGLLARLQARDFRNNGPAGKLGAAQKTMQRGRPVGVRAAPPERGARLNLIETLRAAAPWQALRRRQAARTAAAMAGSDSAAPDGSGASSAAPGAGAGSAVPGGRGAGPAAPDPSLGPGRVLLCRDDFRITRMEARSRTTTIFVVDASGSSALNRLAEAKGAVELLLADCYRRRDQVAVVAFRGRSAQVLLPPTRSLVRAKRSLAGLPGGGGTPLAAGIDAAFLLAETARRGGAAPTLVLLTDGRANVTRAGTAGRDAAGAEAAQAARRVRAAGMASLVLDISPRPAAEAGRLARDMGALYMPLPYANAASVSSAVRAAARR